MSRSDSTDGFSLLEMLVVLAILSLTAGAAYSGMAWRKPRETLNSLSQKITQAAAAASLRAILKGETASLEVDVTKRLVSGGHDGDITVPSPFNISLLTGAGLIKQDRLGIIEFYSDGSSSGGEIALGEADGRTSSIRIYWLTGAISVRDGTKP